MKKLLYIMAATPLLLANNSRADDAPLHPQFKLSRQDEDWSVLRDPALRTDAFDVVKFIPLNRDGSSWLTLGGEVRQRYEYFDNFNWGKGPQDDNGYMLQRYMIHADAHIGENFRVFTQFKSGLEDGRNGGPRPTDRDEFDMHQLFADVLLMLFLGAMVAGPTGLVLALPVFGVVAVFGETVSQIVTDQRLRARYRSAQQLAGQES